MPRTGARPAVGCWGIDGTVPGDSCEQAHVPAQQPPPCQDARVPAADADPGGPRHPVRQAPQGPRARQRLAGSACSPVGRIGVLAAWRGLALGRAVFAQGGDPWNLRGGRSVVALVRFADSVSLRMGLWTSRTAPSGAACRAQHVDIGTTGKSAPCSASRSSAAAASTTRQTGRAWRLESWWRAWGFLSALRPVPVAAVASCPW